MNNIQHHPRQESAYQRSLLRGLCRTLERDEIEKKIMERILRRSTHAIYIAMIICAAILGDKFGHHDGVREGMDRARLHEYDAMYSHAPQNSQRS